MGKSKRKKRRRVKPVNERINYYTNILKIVANGTTKKSENEIFNMLVALNEGLNYKRDAIDAIHVMAKNKILDTPKSEKHRQRYDVQLAPLGDELVSMEKCRTEYHDLQ
jgi:hypothetical protein